MDPVSDPVCPDRLDPDPDPVNIRPDLQPCSYIRHKGPCIFNIIHICIFNIIHICILIYINLTTDIYRVLI